MDYTLMDAEEQELRSLISLVQQPDGSIVAVDEDPERCAQLRTSLAEHEARFDADYAAFCERKQSRS